MWFLAIPLPEGLTGQTPGKKLLRLKVIRKTGAPTNIGRSLIRQLFTFLEILSPIGLISLILINTNPRKARIGDLLAGTYVVDKE